MSSTMREELHNGVRRRAAPAIDPANREPRQLRVLKFATSIAVPVMLVTALPALGFPDISGDQKSIGSINDSSSAPSEPQAIDVNGHPISIAVGERAVWAGMFGDPPDPSYSVVRIDPKTNSVTASIEVDGRPEDIVVGGGAVWVSLSHRPESRAGTLVKIDPMTNAVVDQFSRIGRSSLQLAFGSGSVWVATGKGRVKRFDPELRAVTSKIKIGEYALVAATEGATWAVDIRGSVFEIDPESNVTHKVLEVGWNVTDMQVHRDDLWILQLTPERDHMVVRVDGETGETVGDPVVLDTRAGHLAVGHADIWVLQLATRKREFDQDGTIVRIDPKSQSIDGDPIHSGGGSLDFAFGEGSLWVVKPSEGIVYRIDPDSN